MTEKEINIFKDNDIPFADFEIDKDSRFGSDILRGVKEIQAGVGDLSFNVNESGIWLGAKKFMDAPFSVDMQGHVIAGSIALSGYIPIAGAAADINNNTTQINGGKIVTGSINASSMVVGSLRQVFTSTPTTPYAVGDLWSQGSSGDLKRCINARTSGSYVSSDWDLASKYTDDSNTTTIIGNTVTTSYLNAKNITAAGIVTGALIQTSSYAYTGIKISSSIGGMDVYGETIEIFSTGGVSYGTIGSGGAYLDIASTSNRNIRISPWGGSVFFGLNSGSGIAPTTSGQGNCGLSSQYWANVYTNNIVLSGGNYINYTGGYIQSNSQFRVVGSIRLTGNLVFENAASITINGTTFYATSGSFDSSKYYLRS